MNECTRFDVSVCIDVEIESASCNTSVYILSVIPEVKSKDWSCLSDVSYKAVHVFPLLRACDKFWYCIASNRHVGEEPCKLCSLLNHVIDECIVSDCFNIFTCVTAGDSKWKFVAFENLHSLCKTLVDIFTAAFVGCLGISFDTDCRNEVSNTKHLLCELLID